MGSSVTSGHHLPLPRSHHPAPSCAQFLNRKILLHIRMITWRLKRSGDFIIAGRSYLSEILQ